MVKCFLILVLLISGDSLSQHNAGNNAYDFVNSKIKIIESFYEKGYADDELLKTIEYLETLTGIIPCLEYSIEQQPHKYTTTFILNDWKNWLELNRSNIDFDKNTGAIVFVNNAKQLEKNPKDEFLKYVEIIKNNMESDFYNLSELYCAHDYVVNLIGYDSNDLDWNDKKELVLPTQYFLERINLWYKENAAYLIWNKEKQMITLNR